MSDVGVSIDACHLPLPLLLLLLLAACQTGHEMLRCPVENCSVFVCDTHTCTEQLLHVLTKSATHVPLLPQPQQQQQQQQQQPQPAPATRGTRRQQTLRTGNLTGHQR
ncbi:hypothetical protein AWZ03_007131 [Drosophila navojoa]|uniref:KASH domain-containing protein n=1 Tax=Drosophila navojoa TaxID=7232 RepID=A0A484BF95_DRONA|nr:hypothetical protein AWZ03_007131 [Drosophila navojoa]